MQKRHGIYFLVAVLFMLCQFAFGQAYFTAKFSAAQEVSEVNSNATGTGVFILTDAGLAYHITIEGLKGNFAAAHFHNAPMGVNGGVVRTLTGDFTNFTASGVWTALDPEPLTPQLVKDLIAGNLYVNVHTDSFPSGEIRAQVHPSSGSNFEARLSPSQETHSVTSNGSGIAFLTLTEAGLSFHLTIDALSGPFSAAHFHNGPAGQNGGVVRTITGDFTGNTASGFWTADDSEPLTEALIKELLAGNLYLNVHTSANPAGEIRGQIFPSGGIGLSANLDSGQQGGTVNSDATGTAALLFTNDGVLFQITVQGLTSPMTLAHFHHAPAGQNGPPVRTLTSDFNGNQARGIWSFTDPEPLTSELVKELLAGNIYINVHTDSFPAGEIRGQVGFNLSPNEAGFAANLSPAQEVHNVTSDARGTGNFTLAPEGLKFNITIEGLKGNFAAAHFHNAALGVNGGVVRTLSGDFNGNSASGTWSVSDPEPLTPQLITALLKGDLYVNVHTDSFPSGEIRGQVNLQSGTKFQAKLTSDQEVQTVTSDAKGSASFTFTDAGLVYDVTVEGLSAPISAAHFHNAAAGVNGGVVRTISGDFNGNTASGVWAATDPEPLTPALIQQLLAGNLYLNVHTSNNPGGEIRGQVLLGGGMGFTAGLDAAQEVGTVTSDAMGTSSLTLASAGLIYNLTIQGLQGTFTMAHFHNAPAGVNGGVVRTITSEFNGNTAFGIWSALDPEPLTIDLVKELADGNLYLNVHSNLYPSGEIRGQIGPTAIITGIEPVANSGEIPRKFFLHQNFPNPFNPSTEIRFDINRPGLAVLTIYNALGQVVKIPVNEELPAGSYQLTLDAGSLPSGIYFYRLEHNGSSQTRKMMLIR